ncbi:MAG: hypothetical protein IPK71_02285 [Myxococcales bacterium]|nr:hypothetical protein [Myxococcales bacterium]
MSVVRTVSFFAALSLSIGALAGCTAESSDPVVLKGRIGSGSSSTTTKTFGGLTGAEAGLHVTARELHKKGATGRKIDVPVAPDGTFAIDVPSGARWVLTVDGTVAAAEKSALFALAQGKSVLDASVAKAGDVELGAVKVVGGQAIPELPIDGKAGLASALAEAEEVFESAQGAIVEARAAADEARAAAEKAQAEAEAARLAAEKAAKDAAEAAKNVPTPGLPGGS